jgi:hypothetical protein
MLASAITLWFLLAQQSAGADSSACRQIAAPCPLVEAGAVQYLKEHDFYAYTATKGSNIFIAVGPRKGASAPSGKPLSLDRFSIHRYSLPRHLSPLKTYDFRVEGHLRLEQATAGSCNASLRFEISAYEWVWALAVIDDGYRSQFSSNGVLERLYIDAIGNLFRP